MGLNEHALVPQGHRVLRRHRYLESTIPVLIDEPHEHEHDDELHDEQRARLIAILQAEKEAL